MFLLFVICMLIGSNVQADVVHLRNGKEVEGKIIREDSKSIIIKMDGSNFTYYIDEVDHIERMEKDKITQRYFQSTEEQKKEEEKFTTDYEKKMEKDPVGMELAQASAKGDLAKVQDLVASGADVNKVSGPEGLQQTPLQFAVGQNHMDVAKFLLENGADINKSAWMGPAILIAITKNDVAMVKFLIEQGADVNPQLDPSMGSLIRQAQNKPEILALLQAVGSKEVLAKEKNFSQVPRDTVHKSAGFFDIKGIKKDVNEAVVAWDKDKNKLSILTFSVNLPENVLQEIKSLPSQYSFYFKKANLKNVDVVSISLGFNGPLADLNNLKTFSIFVNDPSNGLNNVNVSLADDQAREQFKSFNLSINKEKPHFDAAFAYTFDFAKSSWDVQLSADIQMIKPDAD